MSPEVPEPVAIPPSPFVGPDALAQAVITSRGSQHWRANESGTISPAGVHELIRVAYYTSQLPYEASYPRITLFVTSLETPTVHMNVSLQIPLTVATLRRLGPVLEPPELALVVREQPSGLQIIGITSRAFAFTEMALGDSVFTPEKAAQGLIVEIKGAGDLRAGEGHRHRLVGGVCRQETNYFVDDWFLEWAVPTIRDLLGPLPGGGEHHPNSCGSTLATLWGQLIWRIAGLRHGGCLVVLPDPCNPSLPIRHTFRVTALADLGTAFASVYHSVEGTRRFAPGFPPPPPNAGVEVRERVRRRQELIALLDTLAQLSATDGCVVFNRALQLYSFGSMIEPVPGGQAEPRPPCFTGSSDDPVPPATLQAFGARRRSAIQLCQSCPGALAFVISQDGDLRAIARRGEAVRLYDNLSIWSDVT